MEDRTMAVNLTGHEALPVSDRAGLFSVYDGHGGHQVAEFLAENVQSQLLSAGAAAIAEQPLRVLGNAVENAERQLLVSYAEGDSTAAAGSTMCAVLLLDDKLHVAHVGDSRAVLARGTAAKQLTRDHKPACEIEAKRIMSDDPEAEITKDGYLYSELAVARAIGSAHLKRDPSKRALIATAEVATVQLERQDDFVIVATDGLWDTVSSNEAVSIARRILSETKDAAAASRALVERAQRCGSSDNISVVVLLLHDRSIQVPRSNSRLFKRPAVVSSPGSVSTGGNSPCPA
jgi:protein phosphatase 2C family protein 2/3